MMKGERKLNDAQVKIGAAALIPAPRKKREKSEKDAPTSNADPVKIDVQGLQSRDSRRRRRMRKANAS